MPDDSYKGDSPNKKVVRCNVWLFLLDIMHDLKIKPKAALVLAGHGGDLSVLSGAVHGIGYDAKSFIRNSTAIDIIAKHVANCKEEYGCHGEVGTLVDKIHLAKPYNTSHMDFCNGVSLDNVHSTLRAINNAEGPLTFHVVTLMRGRENKRTEKHDILVDKKASLSLRRTWAREMRKQFGRRWPPATLFEPGYFNVKGALRDTLKCLRRDIRDRDRRIADTQFFNDNGKLTYAGTSAIRVKLFVGMLAASLSRTHILQPIYINAYQSHTRTKRGTPFVTFVIAAMRLGSTQFEWEVNLKLFDMAMKRAKEHPLHLQKGSLYHGAEAGHENMIRRALELDSFFGAKMAAQLLNVSTGTIAAWKAHKTRGTYVA